MVNKRPRGAYKRLKSFFFLFHNTICLFFLKIEKIYNKKAKKFSYTTLDKAFHKQKISQQRTKKFDTF